MYPDLRKHYREIARDVILSLNSKQGMGVPLETAHTFLNGLMRLITDKELGNWFYVNFIKEKKVPFLKFYKTLKNTACIGNVLKTSMKIETVCQSLQISEPGRFTYVLQTLHPKILGKTLETLSGLTLESIFENSGLSEEELVKVLDDIQSQTLEKIFEKLRKSDPSQKATIKILLRWLFSSEEYKNITDMQYNGRLAYLACRLRDAFPEIKTISEVDELGEDVAETFSLCYGKVKRNELKRSNEGKLRKFKM